LFVIFATSLETFAPSYKHSG